MDKPKIQKEIAIDKIHPEHNIIYFYGTMDVAQELKEFGRVQPWNTSDNFYRIDVDRRYNFQEVISYINHYGETYETIS